MIPSKYNMHIGKSINGIMWTQGKSIDSSGAVVDSNSQRYVSSKISLTGLEYIWQFWVAGDFVIYNSNNVKVTDYDIQYDSGIIDVRNYSTGGYYAMICISSINGYAASGKYNFVYAMQSCAPYYSKLAVQFERESNQKFYRKKLSSDIKFVGQDYDYLKEASIDSKFVFRIEEEASGKEMYAGTFNKAGCKFDIYKRQCTPEFSVLDKYTEILNNWENTYNVIGLAPKISDVNASLNPVIQSYVRGSSTIAYFFAGTYQEADVLETVDDADALVNTYHFAYIGTGNELNISGITSGAGNGAYVANIAAAYANMQWQASNGWYMTVEAYTDETHGVLSYFKLFNNSGVKIAEARPFAITIIGHTGAAEGGIYLDADAPSFDMYEDLSAETLKKVCSVGTYIVYHVYQRLLTNKTSVNGTSTHEIGTSDMAVNNINYKRCVGLTGGRYFFSAKTSDEPTMFGINDSGKYFDNHFIPLSQGSWRPLPVCRSSWGNASVWYAYDWMNNAWPTLVDAASTALHIRHAYALWDTIGVLLGKTAHIMHDEYDSLVLYGNSSGYVNGAKFYPVLAPKSNILKANYDQPAQKAETSLKEILDNLATMFNCYWAIESNRLVIEHSYYFDNNNSYSATPEISVDITTLFDRFNQKQIEYFQGEIEYNNDDLHKRFEMSLTDKSTELFDLVTMETNSEYVKQDSKLDLTPKGWATDVDLMLAIPDNFSEDGFALLLCTGTDSSWTTFYHLPMNTFTGIVSDDDIPFSAYMQNGYASWIYLSRFFLYYAAVQQYTINKLGDGLQFASKIIKSMEHKLRLPTSSILTPGILVKTEIGNGLVVESEYDLVSQVSELTIAYEPE